MNTCVAAWDAMQLCQERIYRILGLDMVIPDVNSVAPMNRLRALQPDALTIALRFTTGVAAEVKAQGFHDAFTEAQA